MAGTFPCPHCSATYPVKPVLIDRPVRCTQCKNVFMLREHGQADKVGQAEASEQRSGTAEQTRTTSAPAPAVAAAAGAKGAAGTKAAAAERAAAARARTGPPPAKPSAAERAAAARVATGPPPEDPFGEDEDPSAPTQQPSTGSGSQPDTSRRARTSRHTARQEELRRTMAATLSDAASKALKSETVKRANAEEARKKKKTEGAVGNLGPAVLTNYGDNEARNDRIWALGGAVLLVVIVALVWLLTSSSAERAALEAFTEPDPTWRPPRRMQQQQQRAWIADPALPIILNMDEAEIGPSRRVDLGPLRALVQQSLTGHVLLRDHRVYVPEARREASLGVLAKLEDGVEALAALHTAGIPAKPAAALSPALVERGMSERDAELVAWLINGDTALTGDNWIRDQVLAGNVPQALELARFTGSDGRILQRRGQTKYGSEDGITYRGRLLRFDGWKGPQGGKADIGAWHVLDVQVAGRDGRFPDGRGW